MVNFPDFKSSRPSPLLLRPGYRPADLATMTVTAILSLLLMTYYFLIPHAGLYLVMNLIILLFLAVLTKSPVIGSPAWKRFLRLWHPVLIFPFLFTELREIVPAVSPFDQDYLLIHLDNWLFGMQPSVALELIALPLLTEILQIIYATFYFIPLSLGILLVRHRKFKTYDYYLFLICYGFALSYTGYFLVPAIGPRFTLAQMYASPLEGLLLYQPLTDLLNYLESIHRDCFPSGHTMMTLVTLHFAFFHERRYFWWMLTPCGLLVFSTVYLRYHYGSDVLAGLLWYLLALLTAPVLYRVLLRLQSRPFLAATPAYRPALSPEPAPSKFTDSRPPRDPQDLPPASWP